MSQILLPQEYISAIKSKEIFPRFRIQLLNPDETVCLEIVEDIISDSGSLVNNYTQGVRRSIQLTLNNSKGIYLPNPNSSIFINRKFKFDLGINVSGIDYWYPNGTYVMSNPDATHLGAEKVLSLSGIDKFSLFDASQLGTPLTETYIIPVGTNIFSAIKSILNFDTGTGYPIDPLEPILDVKYKDAVTSYTITEEAGGSLSNILIDLANNISCDIFYNADGRLVLQDATEDLSANTKPSIWTYSTSELEYLGGSLSYDFQKVVNVCKVIGDNVNGDIATGVSKNTNPFSPFSINRIGERTAVIFDEIISTDALAQERSDYELKKASMMPIQLKLNSTFMCHLDTNACIETNDEFFGLENERFLIKSINIPISINSQINIDAVNIRDLPFYNTGV